jgi:hypothetical protein
MWSCCGEISSEVFTLENQEWNGNIQGDSRSFNPTYGAYSWGNLVQNLLINLESVLNSYGVIVDFLNASL